MDVSRVYRYWGVAALLVWGALALGLNLLRLDAYGIEESAARALLLNWTVSDRVVNPIVALGAPDLRALLFLPLGAYWTGSFVALKVFMLITLFAAATLLYRWSREHLDSESALIASGLLLIAPLSLMQINSVGTGPFLLLGFAAGFWLNQKYRRSGKQLSGWYFTQLLLIFTLVSIHPAGLAYPLALAWEWYANPVDTRQRRQLHMGITLTVIFGLLFSYVLGRPALEFLLNPLTTLGAAALGHIPGDPEPLEWTSGILPALIAAAVIFFQRKRLMSDLLLRMLLLGTLLGLVAADYGWALIVLALVLYYGIPLLIAANDKLGGQGFAGQRGLVMAAVFIMATLFMIGDRGHRSSVINNTLDPHDDIIRALAVETEEMKESFYTISQWPARTMLAIKRPVFPLPPNFETPEELMKNIGKIDFIVFDPFDPKHKQFRDQVSTLNQDIETLIQQPYGVILKVRQKEQTKGASPIL